MNLPPDFSCAHYINQGGGKVFRVNLGLYRSTMRRSDGLIGLIDKIKPTVNQSDLFPGGDRKTECEGEIEMKRSRQAR